MHPNFLHILHVFCSVGEMSSPVKVVNAFHLKGAAMLLQTVKATMMRKIVL